MRGILFALALVVVAFPAWAQLSDQMMDDLGEQCAWADSYPARVNACTKVIESGQESEEETGDDYMHRGVAFEQMGLRAQAIADYRRAMQLDRYLDLTENLQRLGATP